MMLLTKEKNNEWSVDYNNLKFGYVGPTKYVSFYEYMDSKELFNAVKNDRVGFDYVLKIQKELLNKISYVKIGKKTPEQRKVIGNLNKFYLSRDEVINFFRDCSKMVLYPKYKAKQNKRTGTGLKILTSKQMFQRLPIALAQVKAGNNSEKLLNEIKQIVYSLYQSKQITEKVYNNIIKSI